MSTSGAVRTALGAWDAADAPDVVEPCTRPSHRGSAWRRCWRALDDDAREQIVLHVDAGAGLTDPHRAALAVVLARRRHRDAVAAMVAAPLLTILAVGAGAAFGRATRGGEPLDAFVAFITWTAGAVWLTVATVATVLLLLSTRNWRARLRQAERTNRMPSDGG